MTNEQKPRLAGVIDIGSSAIRMVVMQIEKNGEFRKVDRASKPIQFGRDVFIKKVIGRESINQAIRILNGFSELFAAWGIARDDVFVIATSAIREARNRDTFIDRVFIRTGFNVKIADGVEENHLTYLAVLHAIEGLRATFARSSNIIIEVGGGSTELMIMDKGKMVSAHLFRLGTLRLEHNWGGFEAGDALNKVPIVQSLMEQFRGTIAGVNAEYNLAKIKYFVMVGGDARTAALHCGQKKSEHYSIIKRQDFFDYLEKLASFTVEDCVRLLNVSYYEAESLLPALTIFGLFFRETAAEELVVPDVSIREGVLLRFALGSDSKQERQFHGQIFASALSLGRKYHFDEAHGLHVSTLSMVFFDSFSDQHGLGEKAQVLLQVAALLHDIGYFVRATGHHKHGQYLIQNSELFGLSIDELNLVGQIVRYHRSTRPLRDHAEFNALTQEQRVMVLKLTALLRVCDSLDRSHCQRIKDFSLAIKDDDILELTADFQGDISLERQALVAKSELFEDVFGYRIAFAGKN